MNGGKDLRIQLATCALILALAVTSSAAGTTIYVDANGAADFITIQAAINDANEGDEIEVAPGTYNEAINFNGKAIRLYSSGGTEVTIINAKGAYHAVQCISGEDANTILEGFTITGGNANGSHPNDRGGGMYNLYCSPTLTDCIFTTNTADYGGAIWNGRSSPNLTNCIFTENTAKFEGGGIVNYIQSSPTVTNCKFTDNSAGQNGGGMWNGNYSNPNVINCTFSRNSASSNGGGMYNRQSSPMVTNCILWGDTPDEVNDVISTPTVTYSDVQGGYTGTGNLNADPLFVDASAGNLRLIPDSLCIDAGDNNTPNLPLTDLADNPRILDGNGDGTAIVDMGAFEFYQVLNITQGRPYIAIQTAIDDSNDGDEIIVAPGTYYEAINFNGKAIWLYSSGGQNVTTIDGSGAYHVVQCVSGEDANTILEGFTITGGNANGTDSDRYGGGMYCEFSSPTVTGCKLTGNGAQYGGGMLNNGSSPIVTDCDFTDNTATSYGGGMENYNGSTPTVTGCTFSSNSASHGGGMFNHTNSPTVTNCAFSENTVGTNGGGMYNKNNSSTVTNCTFTGNTALSSTYGGGGMFNNNSSPTVTDCTFSGNTASTNGGGMYNRTNSSPTVTNCTFAGNTALSATYGGGGMFNHTSGPTVTNCSFSGNTAGTNGGGMYNFDNSTPRVTNCIFWGDERYEIFDDSESSSTVNYCDIQGGWSGVGNINADPCFVDAAAGNLRLKPDSPCFDAGDNGEPNLPLTDLDGHDRIIDGDCNNTEVVDMGAYEFNYSYIGDLDYQCDVDLEDFAIIGNAWMTQPNDFNWDFACDLGIPADNYIDWRDVAILCENWLTQKP